MSKRFIHFSRFGAYIGELTPMQATRTRNVDQCGVDKVELVLLDNGVDKYDRIVFCDSMGRTCEWIVMSSRESRAKSVPICTVNCYGSMQELSRHFMPTLRRGSKDTPEQALAKALDGTRWSVGQCDEGSGEYSVYHQSSLASVKDIAEAYKMEVEPLIQLSADGNSIAKRSVCLVKRLGRASTALRLDYGSGLSGIDRVLSADDVVTRLYCYGKGVQTTDDDGNATGGYSRKITFADINGGKEYIQDDSLLEVWGVPGPGGSLMHTEGIFEDGDCEDKAVLLAEGRAALAERSKPIVSYEGTVEALGRAGFDANACDLGDNLQMVDTTFPKPLRLSGRVLEIVEDLLGDGSPSSVKVGNVIEGIVKRSDRVQQTIDRLTSSAGSWDSAATLGSAYLDGLIDGLNKVMNETGGYTYIKPGKGLFVYDKPEEANPTMCIQIGGGYFRIADGKNSDGTWNFRTLGNGHGLVADAIVSGTIADKLGRNSWNLTTGTLKTNYMTANNITANGTFKCGYTNWYTMLTSAGELAGYRTTNGSTPTKVGYIDYTASMRDTDTGAVYYGIQMQAQGSVRISSPIISTAATSDRNVTTTYGRTGSVSQPLVSEVHDNHDGTVGWHFGTFVINTINGLFTSYSTVGTTG